MRRKLILGLMSAGVLVGGCTEESPTTVGGELIGEGFQTFEVVLEAASFLEQDTTYDRIGTLNGAPFSVAAEGYAGELYAHTLFRIQPPQQVSYEGPTGTSATDTAFTVVGATLSFVVDSLGDTPEPLILELMEVTESWDARTATWELRMDTAGVAEPWAVPGGTTGQSMGFGTWTPGDTVSISLDSAAAAVWMDSAAADRGGLIRLATEGARARIQELAFRFDVRPESAPDTLVEAGRMGSRVILVTPEPSTPDGSVLRVGGIPSWRSALKFRPLADVEVPCSPGSTSCTLPLRDVTISQAMLLLSPLPVGGRRIERPLRVEARGVLRGPGVPVTRSPLSPVTGTAEPLPLDAFTPAPSEVYSAGVPLIGFIRQNVDAGEDQIFVAWLGLLAQGEQSSPLFGYAEFGSLTSAHPPRLRLMITVPSEEEL